MKHLHQGPIPSSLIANLYEENLKSSTNGAHAIFLGQVRADKFSDHNVEAIDYSAYNEMAEKEIDKIINYFKETESLAELIIYHSIGIVKAGEVSLLVWLKNKHRKGSFDNLKKIVESVKFNVPIWKKELFKDGSHRWIDERK